MCILIQGFSQIVFLEDLFFVRGVIREQVCDREYTVIVIREPLTPQLNCTLPLSTLMGSPDIPQIRRRDLATDSLLSSQWKNPADILSVLLLIGGDIIQKAIAQLSGDYLVPVAFSFGWVVYSFSTLMSIVGDGRLMPVPDYPAKVINAGSGYSRENRSWILGRLLRDFQLPLNDHNGLHIAVFQADEEKEAGLKQHTWYLLAIGGLGMIQNVVVAGVSRGPSTMGIHLKKPIKIIERFKVMDALMDLESYRKDCGRSLLPEFFNGKLRPEEEKWWDGSDKEKYERVRREQRPTSLPEENPPVLPAGNDQQV
ncbi:unnamed protein product [Sphagnum balticum]